MEEISEKPLEIQMFSHEILAILFQTPDLFLVRLEKTPYLFHSSIDFFSKPYNKYPNLSQISLDFGVKLLYFYRKEVCNSKRLSNAFFPNSSRWFCPLGREQTFAGNATIKQSSKCIYTICVKKWFEATKKRKRWAVFCNFDAKLDEKRVL